MVEDKKIKKSKVCGQPRYPSGQGYRMLSTLRFETNCWFTPNATFELLPTPEVACPAVYTSYFVSILGYGPYTLCLVFWGCSGIIKPTIKSSHRKLYTPVACWYHAEDDRRSIVSGVSPICTTIWIFEPYFLFVESYPYFYPCRWVSR